MNIKNIFLFLIVSSLASQLFAQTNEPARLALVAESGEASTALDVLTAQLTGNQKLQLLERNEIEKVYREQGLSAENKDYLKLGQILGADGLLLLDVVRTPQATNLTARLIAVKPGVVLTDGSFPWPLADTAQWAESVSTYLDSFVPKLTVLVKDAIPISVVNLRSAVQSADSLETERQLKLLTIQRLSQERQLFVLERQKMQLLTEEKDLKLDDSAFWNGSYLLEGVVDQNGYSKDTITLDARLTPPKGGAPLQFEISGSRTNFAEVINELAAKVDEALKVNSTVPAWNAADEAVKYFDEAKWALRWGVLSEAQGASDSAWALGKRDMDCVTIQVKAYMSVVLAEIGGFQGGENTYSPPYDVNRKPLGPPPSDAIVQADLNDVIAQHPYGFARKVRIDQGAKIVDFVFANQQPDPKEIDHALHALDLYHAFCQTLPPDELKADSDWYRLGIEDLTSASQVLQHFHFVPESQKSTADKLAGLRASARSVAEWISKSPSVHDGYFLGAGMITSDEGDKLYHTIGESPNIFRCKVQWGCFWQETPEDGVALYRELMTSPVFSYIHDDFWLRDLQTPRLAAWNESDRQRIPTVWGNFVKELDDSTNVLLQLEGKAIALADAESENDMAVKFTNFFDFVFSNSDSLVLVGADMLVSTKTANWIDEDELSRLFYTTYARKLETMNRDYWNTTLQGITSKSDFPAFEKQKQYLKDNTPFAPQEFVQLFMFGFRDYSKAQALEIQPLLAAYKAKLTGPIAMVGAAEVDQVASYVNSILNQPTPSPQPQLPRPQIQPQTPNAPVVATVAAPAPVVAAAAAVPPQTPVPEIPTNILSVNNFLKIPTNQIPKSNGAGFYEGDENPMNFRIVGSRWCEGKLVLDLRYECSIYASGFGSWQVKAVAAIFNPMNESWEIITYPYAIDDGGHPGWPVGAVRFEIYQGDFYYTDGDKIRKYNSKILQWETLNIPGLNGSQLFGIDGHLYAANNESILEIIDGGTGTHLLASTRRRPTVSILDSLDGLGSPILFSAGNHSLGVAIGTKVFLWSGNDWTSLFSLDFPKASSQTEAFDDAIIFRFKSWDYSSMVWFWDKSESKPELMLYEKSHPPAGVTLGFATYPQPAIPVWKQTGEDSLVKAGETFYKSNLFFLVDHVNVNYESGSGRWTATEKDGYQAKLLCFSREVPDPIIFPLKFDSSLGQPPSQILSEQVIPEPWVNNATWMHFAGDKLYIGQQATLGIWSIPVSEIEKAIDAKKQILIEKSNVQEQAARQLRNQVLAKYDLNHNGIIDGDEIEAALDDPAFIESERRARHF